MEKEINVIEVAGEQATSNNNLERKKTFWGNEFVLWISLIILTPLGLILLWTANRNHKKSTRIIITIVFAFIMLLGIPNSDTTNNNSDKYVANSSINTEVADFSTMTVDNANSWCNANKVNCNIQREYSDVIENGMVIKQSKPANSKIKEGGKLDVIYSMGKEPSLEYRNALKTAESYANLQHMSKQAIYEQLTSDYGEGFPVEAAKYAINNLESNWNENAFKTAESYANNQHMSKKEVYNQLISSYGEKFTQTEAKYAINKLYK